MKVIIDTNVLLMSLPKISPYRPIFDGLINGQYQLIITEEIWQEYKEILAQKTTLQIAENLSKLLTQLENVKLTKVFFKWNLIIEDPDDNKFVDGAISGNAKYIVSNDKHFRILKNIAFPKVDVIKADVFLKEIST